MTAVTMCLYVTKIIINVKLNEKIASSLEYAVKRFGLVHFRMVILKWYKNETIKSFIEFE